jgi:hypothetical protein
MFVPSWFLFFAVIYILELFSWYTLFHSSANQLNFAGLQNSAQFGVTIRLLAVIMFIVSLVDTVKIINQSEECGILFVITASILPIRKT